MDALLNQSMHIELTLQHASVNILDGADLQGKVNGSMIDLH